jgi:hypothetical protein
METKRRGEMEKQATLSSFTVPSPQVFVFPLCLCVSVLDLVLTDS